MAESAAAPPDAATRSLPPASTTLVIVGHGSHLSARSAEPVYAHADSIRDRGVFADVRTAFWKEEPSPREVLRTVETDDAVVVPSFMAAGYFTADVLPRELRLTEGSAVDVDGTVRYAPPVGTHEALTAVVVERADRFTGDLNLGDGVGLAIVGHGTERNPNSAAAARAHAARIRERGPFDEVRALYVDESPTVGSLTDHFATDDVVLVPLFVADGRHTRVDIPDAVGLSADGDDVPTAVDDHRVWDAGAVGTDPRIADVILERAWEVAAAGEVGRTRSVRRDGTASVIAPDSTEFGPVSNEFGSAPTELEPGSDDPTRSSRRGRAFLRWVEGADEASGDSPRSATPSNPDRDDSRATGPTRRTRTWGQLRITAAADADGSRTYELRHEADGAAEPTELDRLDRLRDLRDRVRYDDEGDFRPLRTAPTLPTSWRLPELDGPTLVRAVETVYPATIANWYRERTEGLDVAHFGETADRQTGRYERVAALDRTDVETAATACCTAESCLKRRRWDYDDEEPLDVPRGDGAVPCREPCSLLLETAREVGPDASAGGVTD